MGKDPVSGLILPKRFIDEKTSLKKVIDTWLDKAVLEHQYLKERYFLTFHAKFNPINRSEFTIDAPKITSQLPPFMSNTMVYYVSNEKGICELLWMISSKKPGEKLKVDFNQQGIAYLQAKGAMPRSA